MSAFDLKRATERTLHFVYNIIWFYTLSGIKRVKFKIVLNNAFSLVLGEITHHRRRNKSDVIKLNNRVIEGRMNSAPLPKPTKKKQIHTSLIMKTKTNLLLKS